MRKSLQSPRLTIRRIMLQSTRSVLSNTAKYQDTDVEVQYLGTRGCIPRVILAGYQIPICYRYSTRLHRYFVSTCSSDKKTANVLVSHRPSRLTTAWRRPSPHFVHGKPKTDTEAKGYPVAIKLLAFWKSSAEVNLARKLRNVRVGSQLMALHTSCFHAWSCISRRSRLR